MTNRFDPYSHEQPAPALVQHLQGLPLRRVASLPDGTLIKSIAMNNGLSKVRRFAVSAKGKAPLPRQATKFNTVATAADAARLALGKGGRTND